MNITVIEKGDSTMKDFVLYLCMDYIVIKIDSSFRIDKDTRINRY